MSVWTMDYKTQVTIRIYILMVNAVFNCSSILSPVYLKMCRKHSSKSNNMKVFNINTKFIFTYCAREGTEKTWSYPVTCISAILKKRKQEEMLKCNNIIVTTYLYQKFKLKKYYHTRNTKLNRFLDFCKSFSLFWYQVILFAICKPQKNYPCPTWRAKVILWLCSPEHSHWYPTLPTFLSVKGEQILYHERIVRSLWTFALFLSWYLGAEILCLLRSIILHVVWSPGVTW